MNLGTRVKYIRINAINQLFRYSTNSVEPIEQNEQVLFDDTDDAQAKEAEIEKKRNKSGLSVAHYNLVHGRRPYIEPMCRAHLTVKYNRKLYGKYGSASGINPSICWPTEEDVKETLEYETVAYPYTIKQVMEMVAEKKREEQLKIEEREKEIVAKFEKLDQWKQDLHNKIAKKTAEAQRAKEKKERLVEEVRRHFGFKLDPRDERFQEMLVKREKEQKKLEKQARKDAKEKLAIAKLQQQNVEMSSKPTKMS